MQQTENYGGSRIKEIVCEDRISVLPEDLLLKILSFVPTKDAVATMFLSKRWLSVWTMILSLEYKESEEDLKVDVEDSDDDSDDDDEHDDDVHDDEHDDDDDDEPEHDDYWYYINEYYDYEREEEGFDNDEVEDDEDKEEKEEDDDSRKSVWWFLDKSLQLHKAPVIDSLCMELGRRCPTDVDVGKWVENAVDRDVYGMTFKLLWSADPVSLPTSFYSCKSLTKLTLSHKILVDVTSPACLPSLKILVLDYVVYKDDESLVRFLSSCTVLEDLTIRRNKKDDNVTNFSVKVPSLLYFYYENDRRLPKDIDVGDTGRCLIMDTPALTDLTIYDSTGDSCSCSSGMPCLDYAHIDVDFFPDNKLQRILSSVLSVVLCMTDAAVASFSTIKYSRLIEFTVCPEKPDWMEPTVNVLQNSPKLKFLRVNYEFTDEPEDIPLSWNQPSSVPGCLSSQLEIFEWNKFGGREEEFQFLTYILANSKCLKTATISLAAPYDPEDQEQAIIMFMLEEIPRVSTQSQLMFKT